MININTYFQMIDKYYKKKKAILFFELIMENYNNRNLYFRIDYLKKEHVYSLSFIDLDHIESNKIDTWITNCILDPNSFDYIAEVFTDLKYKSTPIENNEYRVTINAYFKEHTHIQFKRFLPIELYYLTESLIILFNHAPKKMEGYFFELVSYITGNQNRYMYKDVLDFDLEKGKLDSLFSKEEIKKGKHYIEDEQVLFLEKIDTKYYAVLEGAEYYVVIVDYDVEKKKVRLFCNCPTMSHCKHLYAVLNSIQKKEWKPFYKLVYQKDETPYLQRLLNFKFYLCIGIEQEGLKIVNKDGFVEIIPLLDINNECNWEILEDDKKGTLEKQIKTITSKKVVTKK